VVLLHGLQSHSGWFVQSAQRLASVGFPVYAFDRCGSGISRDGCDGEGLAGVLSEIETVAVRALGESGHRTFHLLGHCFGALPALLYAAERGPDRVHGLVLATPALYTRTDLRPLEKARVAWSVLTRRPTRMPVPLAPEEFSELPPFIEFVRSDPLVRKDFPARFLFDIGAARRRLPHTVEQLRAPLLIAMAGEDPICDNPRNRELLRRVRVPSELHEYSGARHVLEFSAARDDFLADLGNWFERREAS